MRTTSNLPTAFKASFPCPESLRTDIGAKAALAITGRNRSTVSLHNHEIVIMVNPWSMAPLPRTLTALQHHSLLLAAQQQSLQHSLLKHILSCGDLNSRVRGIAAYEEYEALLRDLKTVQFQISLDELETAAEKMTTQIARIFDNHPRLQQHYSEIQRRLLQSSWHTMHDLLANENRTSPRHLQVKRVQHCWIKSRLWV